MNSLINGNQIKLLRNGAEYFPALLTAIDNAAYEIYLQTYIFELDDIGKRIADALKRAASRGVLVYVLLDGFGTKDMPKSFKSELEENGVEVLTYRPKISPWTFKKSRLRRMHRKMAVIDGRVGFVGGINIVDDFNTPPEMAPRIDYAVEVIGPLVSSMHASVLQLWQTVCRAHLQPLRKSLLREDIVQEASGNMRAALLLRDNILHRSDIEDAYLSMIKSAKSEILIANAYFLPGLRFRHALRDAAQRGVRVTLLLQGRTDHLFVGLASQALYSALLGQGVRIYEYHKSFMHSKVAVADDRWAMVGSSNIDPFSLMLSREANILIKDDGFACELRQDIEASINAGATLLSADEWQQRHYIKRFFSWFLYGLVRLLVGVIGHANNY